MIFKAVVGHLTTTRKHLPGSNIIIKLSQMPKCFIKPLIHTPHIYSLIALEKNIPFLPTRVESLCQLLNNIALANVLCQALNIFRPSSLSNLVTSYRTEWWDSLMISTLYIPGKARHLSIAPLLCSLDKPQHEKPKTAFSLVGCGVHIIIYNRHTYIYI